jgi:hypothetical protein
MFQLPKESRKRKRKNDEVKLLPVNLADEELEVFDGCVPPSLFTINDDEPMVCNIDPDDHQFTEEITAPYLVSYNLFMYLLFGQSAAHSFTALF